MSELFINTPINPSTNASASTPLSQYPIPSLDSLPNDILECILAVQEKAKFIPNVFLALAYRPAEFRAFFAYYDAVMERKGSTLSPAEKEMIIVATSAQWVPILCHCPRCATACIF